jgi:ABC-2 type transport system ATP-binding protein
VFLTTHYLDEADTLSDRIVIIDRGTIVASDTSDNLKAQVAGDLVDLEVADEDKVSVAAQRLSKIAEPARHGMEGLEVDGRHVRGRVQRAGKAIPGLMSDLERADISLDSIEVHRPTLDDVFLTLTGRSLRDAEAAAEPVGGVDEPTQPTQPTQPEPVTTIAGADK